MMRIPMPALLAATGLAATALSPALSAAPEVKMISLDAGDLRLSISPEGRVAGMYDRVRRAEYLPAGQATPLLILTVDGKEVTPTSAAYAGGTLTLAYPGGAAATINAARKRTHLTLELASVTGAAPSQVFWGLFPTTISETVGATVGVVRDGRAALGIQSLNIRTVGGAAPKPYGSALFAYSRERDGGVKGSKIALFGCAADKALERIGEIEVAEGLPHPMLDGVWGKVSPTARLSYLITPYGEGNIDQVLAFAQKGGFRYVYHPGPFRTWGHFQLHPEQFPEGDASLRWCAEKAERLGIRLGVHTLTGFITPNDPYVTPVPDPRLARLGSSTLTAAIDEGATEIPVADVTPFRQRQTLSTAILGRELVQYDGVAEGRLTGCQRGAFGTKPSAHATGADIGKLADHAYRTFYPGVENGMMDEMTGRLVGLFNATGLRQISFDGLEGLSTYGHGEYARYRFVRQCFDGWRPEVISDASNLLHFNWHVNTRMNWGELTQSAKVDVDTYRAKNCKYFEENLFPTAMGWWRFGGATLDWEATRLEDIEYLLAKCAGWNACHGLQADPGSFLQHGYGEACLAMVKAWDEARTLGAFSDEQRRKLREKGRDFRLAPADAGGWSLTEVRTSPFTWLTPGAGRKEPADPEKQALSFTTESEEHPGSTLRVANPFTTQPLRFELRALGAFDYDHPENIDLTPAAAPDLKREPDLHRDAPTLTVADAEVNEQRGYSFTTRWEGKEKPSWVSRVVAALPGRTDLRKHRGLGFWVRGDGKGELLFVELVSRDCKRQYYAPITFTGDRYFEFPLGEMCLGRYYEYDWNHWSGFASWWVTLKGFDYGAVDRITIGFSRIPARQEVSCAVGGIRALKELGTGLRNPTVACAGKEMRFRETLAPGSYLVYEGGESAEVRDANFRLLREVPAEEERIRLQAGESTLTVGYEGADGPAPWSRWQVQCLGASERVRRR